MPGPIAKLKARIRELERELADTKTQLSDVEAERDALHDQLTALQEWRDDQNSIVRKMQDDFGGLVRTPTLSEDDDS